MNENQNTELQKETGKLFVLDTNVLMHDPSALFRFQEHDVFIPMVVLEELDRNKKGVTEVARNARQASRFLHELVYGESMDRVSNGIPIGKVDYAARIDYQCRGRLFFDTVAVIKLADGLSEGMPDNFILSAVLEIQKSYPYKRVILVSKDINVRIKAYVLGIRAEDYSSDEAVDDINLLYSGSYELPANFWETHDGDIKSWNEHGRAFYKISDSITKTWHSNQFIFSHGGQKHEFIVKRKESGGIVLEQARSFYSDANAVWGIKAKNREQNCALNALMDPQIDFVTLLGVAGTGKTLLAIASAIHQILEPKSAHYREIIFTRATIPLGDDIGFLPGTEEEKMTPWVGALLDNLELLNVNGDNGHTERSLLSGMVGQKIKIRSINFMRGRTFLNRYIILDEAQNLTTKQVKALITRAGPGTKVVCLGNIGQIDNPYLSATTSGLSYAVEKFKDWPHSAHITLLRGERSRLADFANENL